jgi:hypothetical protein
MKANYYKKLYVVFVLGAAVSLTGSAGVRYWNGQASNDWSAAANFQTEGTNLMGAPQSGDTVMIENWASRVAIIDQPAKAPLRDMYLSRNTTIAEGGQLKVDVLKIGKNANAILIINGGELQVIDHLDVAGYNGNEGALIVSGGSVVVKNLVLNLEGTTTGGSIVEVSGGKIVVGKGLSINTNHDSFVHFTGGSLVLPRFVDGGRTDNLELINSWVSSGNIIAYSREGTVRVDVQSSPGEILLSGVR